MQEEGIEAMGEDRRAYPQIAPIPQVMTKPGGVSPDDERGSTPNEEFLRFLAASCIMAQLDQFGSVTWEMSA